MSVKKESAKSKAKPKKSAGVATKNSTKTSEVLGDGKRFWLIKSEPDVFSIDDLAKSPAKTTFWDGVRNYQARNTMRDEMKKGDFVLFYHSNASPPGIAGVVKVVREGYPDHTAFDEDDPHYDPKSKKGNPTWYMVDVKLVKKFKAEISLSQLKAMPELEGMVLLQKGSRLSVQPVRESEMKAVLELAGTSDLI